MAGRIELEPDKIVATIEGVQRRIEERFPGSGLARLAAALQRIAEDAVGRGKRIHAPQPWLRLLSGVLLAAMGGVILVVLTYARPPPGTVDVFELVQVVEATLSALVLLGAAVLFVVTLEVRIKRRRALDALHELRVMAHVVDMHQLEKDPERAFPQYLESPSSPQVRLSVFELDRYLNYCGDLLALIGKIAAFYVQGFQDTVILATVNEIEDLTNGLSRKIWQKLMLLDQMAGDPRATGAGNPGST